MRLLGYDSSRVESQRSSRAQRAKWRSQSQRSDMPARRHTRYPVPSPPLDPCSVRDLASQHPARKLAASCSSRRVPTLFLQRQKFTRRTPNVGKQEPNPPNLALVLESVFANELEFLVQTLGLERPAGDFGDLGVCSERSERSERVLAID
jgi:hypothetical protein